MKELKATRVPPGDRWSVVDGDDDKIYSSLTEVLNVIFMQTGISEKEYEGYRFIDVRIYYQDRKTQEWKPTTKGISIMPNNAEEIINGILKAMEVMGFTKEKA